MGHPFRWFRTIAFSALALAALVVAAKVAGPALDGARSRLLPETGGLVFVESPEVYTRQRLVNDRYQQDAWLRRKLEEIDAPGTRFIARTEAQNAALSARIGASGADGGEVPAPVPSAPALPGPGDIPFGAKLTIQSALRDTLRQHILENALDDRHDLSGNTVFGLKFDTAVVPGTNTARNPTVVVKIAESGVEELRHNTPELAGYYARAPYIGDIGDRRTRLAVGDMIGYFDSWRKNLQRRLNRDISKNGATCAVLGEADGSGRAAGFAAKLRQAGLCTDQSAGPYRKPSCPEEDMTFGTWLEDMSLCNGTTGSSSTSVFVQQVLLPSLLRQAGSIDDVLDFNLRVPPRNVYLGTETLDWVRGQADQFCQGQGRLPVTVGAFLRGLRGQASPPVPLPDPWGDLFNVQVSVRPPTGAMCANAPVDLRLLEREIGVMIVEDTDGGAAGALAASGLSQLGCIGTQCEGDAAKVWLDLQGIPDSTSITDRLDIDVLNVLARDIKPSRPLGPGEDACLSRAPGHALHFGRTGDGPWQFVGDDAGSVDLARDFFTDFKCLRGRAFQMRVGAFLFLQRMAAVDSYTYAAFPRGDVTGVVTETGQSAKLDASLAAPGTPEWSVGAGSSSARRSIEAQPSIINFATGGGDALFDFGWMIVKPGLKEPMVASQVVLVSVPAYLDQIGLEIWRGFMEDDFPVREDGGPVQGDAGSADPVPPGGATPRAIMEFMEKTEATAMTLRVPPDFKALDGIVVGNDILSGPRIDKETMRIRQCHHLSADGRLSIDIPGDRLWRSTVVTLEGVKADRIEVMPDMEGILAMFAPLQGTGKAEDADGKPALSGELPGSGKPVTLAVWTSEGNDRIEIRICGSADGPEEPAATEPESADDPSGSPVAGAE
ncbi:hypothetical protein [Mangrovicoccus sp. HB161399]|uniref:hypothetical protein n=1 Tax=Mangrovicoccus sp. HB161399 TaxID=2720392 RepID=UPI001551B17A|nr:hypothetical protein [Mangrovicoccus sp. HB161399]